MRLVPAQECFDRTSVASLDADVCRFVRPLLIGATIHSSVAITGTWLTSACTEGVFSEIELQNTCGAVLQAGGIDLIVATRPL